MLFENSTHLINTDMVNISYYVEFKNRRTLTTDVYYELLQSLSTGRVIVLWIIITSLVGCALLQYITVYYQILPHLFQKRSSSTSAFFVAFQDKIRDKFKNQKEETFRTIVMGTNHVLRTIVEDPTVFLVLVPMGAMPTAERFVKLLIHCTLVAYDHPADDWCVNRVITDGNKYRVYDDQWPLLRRLKNHLSLHGVAAILSFESLHPQVIRTLQLLVPLYYSPFPASVLILVVDIRNRFSHEQKQATSPNSLGKVILEEQLGNYFDRREMLDTINQIGYRCILINTE